MVIVILTLKELEKAVERSLAKYTDFYNREKGNQNSKTSDRDKLKGNIKKDIDYFSERSKKLRFHDETNVPSRLTYGESVERADRIKHVNKMRGELEEIYKKI